MRGENRETKETVNRIAKVNTNADLETAISKSLFRSTKFRYFHPYRIRCISPIRHKRKNAQIREEELAPCN